MNEFEVNCIHKPNRLSPHEHITQIGHSGIGWCMTREDAIRRIDAGTERYYTIDRQTGNRVYIGVVKPVGRHPYLQTYADGKWNDNLLAQPECPEHCRLVG